MGTFLNIVRVKRLIKLSKAKRKDNRPIIFALDLAGAFDNVPRKILLRAIQRKIDI